MLYSLVSQLNCCVTAGILLTPLVSDTGRHKIALMNINISSKHILTYILYVAITNNNIQSLVPHE